MSRPDVLVVGLGPAGASAALAAARAGARVLAVDRRSTPGEPIQCAELVAEALIAACPHARASSLQQVAGLVSRVGGASAHRVPFRGRIIDRAALDRTLVQDAARAGGETRLGCAVTVGADGTVRLDDGTLVWPRLIVAADGPGSTIGRAVGRRPRAVLHTRQVKVRLRRPTSEATTFHEPGFGGGYGWLFPRGTDAWLGLGLEVASRCRLAAGLHKLRLDLLRTDLIAPEVFATTGGAIPVGGTARIAVRLGSVPVLFAGDAAGLTHPVSGAGIAAAILSGELVGNAASAWAGGDETAVADYVDEIADLYGPSHARALARRAERLGGGTVQRTWIGFPDYWQGRA